MAEAEVESKGQKLEKWYCSLVWLAQDIKWTIIIYPKELILRNKKRNITCQRMSKWRGSEGQSSRSHIVG